MSPEMIETLLALCFVSAAAGAMRAKIGGKPGDPVEGQMGKDLVWVPTPPALVDRMLDMAEVKAGDYVIDLGSGDGRCVIAAAKRGARALGVEYDLPLLDLSRRNALKEGVADRASFVRSDFFDVDFSEATVLALFLLPDVLEKLEPGFAKLAPGTRIVTNRYGIPGWTPAHVCRIGGESPQHCTALLYVVSSKNN